MLKTFNRLIEINWLNILLITFLLNASKKITLDYVFIRGFLIDYFLIKLHLNTLILFTLSVIFFRKSTFIFLKKNFLYVCCFLVFLLINVLFSSNILNSFFYTLYLIGVLFIFVKTLSILNLTINNKVILVVNIFYILVFMFQYVFQNSFLPYFPFGTYFFNTLNIHLDYSSFFGIKMLIPSVNFPHPNLLCAFLSFLNIFHLQRKNYLFFAMNFFVILLSSSFASILFNLLLVFYKIWEKYNHNKLRFFFFSLISFLVSFIFLFFFFHFGFKSVSVSERIFQFSIFEYSISQFPIFGVGANNFIFIVNAYENFKGRIFVLQPIHNIFLLILAEYGISIFVLVIVFFKKIRKYLKPSIFLFYLVFFSLFDHFFITLNQGLLLVLLTIYMHKSIIIDNAP